MYANEVKNLKWVSVSDWSELTMTHFNTWGTAFVGKSDVESFVENVFKDVARKLNIPYTELEPILREENSAFYSTKDRLFKNYNGVSKTHSRLVELEKMLRIPDVTTVPDNVSQSNVDKFLTDFSALSDREKLEILQRLGTVSVKVEFFAE